MYCPECGYKINEQDAIFCPECGTKIAEDTQDSAVKNIFYASGIIFTDVKRLAAKLRTEEHTVHKLLEYYIGVKQSYGVSYSLVDTGNYVSDNIITPPNPDSGISGYMDVLTDAYNRQADRQEINYLFIIGGNDIIPMPRIPHYCIDVKDKTIDTDILYAFPYGGNMMSMLQNAQIFRYQQAFLVGRLPIGEDTTSEDFRNYLERAAKGTEGIPLTEAYGQCDPNWKNVSATVTDDLIAANKLRNLDGYISADCYFRRLILSPGITTDNVNHVFHDKAHLYYYNLHGCNALEARGWFGAHKGQKVFVPALLPEHISSCSVPNIIVCEACYGARFIGLDKRHSMLLSALYAQALLFLGSSRIAWGNVDPVSITEYTPVLPVYADTMALGFISSILGGYSAGQALLIARDMVLKQEGDCEINPTTISTVTEFNLFGDPSLFAVTPEMFQDRPKTLDKSKGIMSGKAYDCKMEQLDLSGNGNSILNLVRKNVDKNISQIRNSINSHLYEYYGIEPRNPDSIFKVKYADGSKELRFNYDVLPGSEISMTYTVRTTENGKIKEVIITK